MEAGRSSRQARDSDIEADDCIQSMSDDWNEDAQGKDYMDQDDFFHCWFQVALGDRRFCVGARSGCDGVGCMGAELQLLSGLIVHALSRRSQPLATAACRHQYG